MNHFICIHGHFYQPPRENPWLEAVEQQDSAYPYHDWNERITAECYAPNAASRILDEEGRIEKIANNYSRISFNFGPTLLAWMEANAPETYHAVLEADKQSQNRFGGHGSAIAQCYNHVIMPLANTRDKVTQVLWGVRDFEHRFQRAPEGMWLPETAVDLETLDILAQNGILFTILEPGQAKRMRKIGSSQWVDVTGGRVDPTRPYRVQLASGRSLAVFFYDGPISRSVAFDGLLVNGATFANRLAGAFSEERSWDQIVNVATDGETYGHHHKFGDMALAYATAHIDENGLGHLVNYGEFLATHPPTHEVEIAEETSWSCVHGIERWRSDCGCRTGGLPGWNQAWRGPLREALDWLRDTLEPWFEREAGKLLRNPWEARNDYVGVILERENGRLGDFLSSHQLRELSEEETVRTLELMEIQRNLMLMYTSCGWFFNEISGIETMQILQYAGRAVQLAEKLSADAVEPEFLDRLSRAHSNVRELGSGREIYRKSIQPAKVDLQRVGAHYAVASLFHAYEQTERIYAYEVEREDYEVVEVGRARVTVGRIRVTSRITRDSALLSFGVLYLGDVHLTGGIKTWQAEEHERLKNELTDAFNVTDFTAVMRLLDQHFGGLTFSIKSLFRDDQRTILAEICNTTLLEAEAAMRRLHDRYLPLMKYHLDLGVPLPKVLSAVAEFDLNLLLRRAFERDDLPVETIHALLKRVKTEKATVDETSLAYVFQQTLERIADEFLRKPNDLDVLQRLNEGVELTEMLPFGVDLRKPQNVYYKLRGVLLPEYVLRDSEGDEEAKEWLTRFRDLGERLWMSAG
ncbi:MAG: DUF3536 domain-containing protein [Thermoanaerobaculia bacterium]